MTHSHHLGLAAIALIAIQAGPSATASAEHPDGFQPATQTPDLYEEPYRQINIRINPQRTLGRVSEHFLGSNLSYFNDTDEIRQQARYDRVLAEAGVTALRYPGGEETSFFHWRHPGVDGYEDLWDQMYGASGQPDTRGPFQTTRVGPEHWQDNQSFLDFDEFIRLCQNVGAEPVVGLNLSSGRAHNRIEEGLEEALAWIRYARDQGYDVQYWFLDNEPWHHEAKYTFEIETEYADDVLLFGNAIKKEFPEAKLIVNPVSWQHGDETAFLAEFFRKTGHVVDFIDLHLYWAWGLGSWDRWRENTPLPANDRWSQEDDKATISSQLDQVRMALERAGHPDIGVMVLEWNLGPSPHTLMFSEQAEALVQADILLELMKQNVEMTAIWPLLWQTRREVWPEQDHFPSLIQQQAPFEPTATRRLFSMLSPLQGGTRLAASASHRDTPTLAVRSEDGTLHVVILNKSAVRRKLMITVGESPEQEGFIIDTLDLRSVANEGNPRKRLFEDSFVPPYSCSVVQISGAP